MECEIHIWWNFFKIYHHLKLVPGFRFCEVTGNSQKKAHLFSQYMTNVDFLTLHSINKKYKQIKVGTIFRIMRMHVHTVLFLQNICTISAYASEFLKIKNTIIDILKTKH